MARRVVLHVGTMKSGTSYLQSLLFAQKPRLAERGVLVAGRDWAQVVRAVRAALNRQHPRRPWDALSSEVRAHAGDAVISMELLGPAADPAAGRVLDALGDAEVQVVVTARDLNRTLVSMWQETVQNGRSWTWEEYYAAAEAERPGAGRTTGDKVTPGGTFWRQQDLLRIVEAWAARVGREQVTLVTVPPPGAPPTLLAERFVEATGVPLDPGLLAPRANESLGLPSALVLRELNERLSARGVEFPSGGRLRKAVLAKSALAALAEEEPRLGLPVAPWVREQAGQTVAGLEQAGVRLVGSSSDLEPVAVPGIRPADVDPRLVTRAAITGLAEVIADVAARRAEADDPH